MRKYGITAIAALALVSFVSFGAAEDNVKENKPAHHKAADWAKKKEERVKARVAMLTKKLNLTAGQQAQVQAILEGSKNEIMAVWDEAKAKAREINKSAHDKIAGILTEEQKEKFKSARADCEREQKGKKEKVE